MWFDRTEKCCDGSVYSVQHLEVLISRHFRALSLSKDIHEYYVMGTRKSYSSISTMRSFTPCLPHTRLEAIEVFRGV